MYYTIYRITNKINGKVYFGKHKTSNLDDGYMGSGKIIKNAILKYGIENFQKDYICFCDSEDQMNLMERSFVDEVAVANNQVYNVKLGGQGGFNFINQNKLNYNCDPSQFSKIANEKKRWLFIHNEEWAYSYKQQLSNARKNILKNGFKGKTHTFESKIKIGLANSIKQKGINNSQYGTCWITNGEINKKIPKDDLDKWIENGYYKGRIKNFKNVPYVS